MPTRHHIMQKPDLDDETGNDVSYKFGVSRVSQHHYLNPLKSNIKLYMTNDLYRLPYDASTSSAAKTRSIQAQMVQEIQKIV
jgi:hypothetical protein